MSRSLWVFGFVLARTKLDFVHLKDATVSNAQVLPDNGDNFDSLGFCG
jgi:hypothetical protein